MPKPGKREYYARPDVAEEYYGFSFGGRSGQWVENREAEILLAMIGDAERVLDLACGEGRLARRVSARACVVGGDTSLPMLESARSSGVRDLTRADAFRLPFAPQTFDCVACARLMFHYLDFELILKELYRVITDDGWIVFDTFRWSPRARLPVLSVSFDGPIYTTSVRDVEARLARERFAVLERKGSFLFSPLVYRYLPFHVVKLLKSVEQVTPDRLLVKDYWKAGKKR